MERNVDVVTGDHLLPERLYTFHNFPVNMLTDAKTSIEQDVFYDMKVGIFSKTGVIQLTDLVPEKFIYVDAHPNVAIGEVWREHYNLVADTIRRYNPRSILEIGGGGGNLEFIYNKRSPRVDSWTIIEPTPHPIPETRATFIRGFFPEALSSEIQFDMLVHTCVLEHMYSPRDFLEKVAEIMPIGGKMIFSFPNMKLNLEKKMTSVINFEHTIFLTDEHITYLLMKFGFEIESREIFKDHSIVYSTVKSERKYHDEDLPDLSNLYDVNKKLYLDYINAHEKKIQRLNERMTQEIRPVYLFGGHIAAQFYVAFGLNIHRIVSIIDNDVSKHGKRVCGTSLTVQAPQVMRGTQPTCVILPESPYVEEIKSGILKDINPNVEFWV